MPNHYHQKAPTQVSSQLKSEVNVALWAMRNGFALILHYENGRPIWRLMSGQVVTAKAAEIVITCDGVVSVGDSLFPGHPGQTWRFRESRE